METEKLPITVGQTVWVKHIGSRFRGSDVSESVVTKVGSKYFYLDNNSRDRYSIFTGMQDSDYSIRKIVYISYEVILEEKEHSILSDLIKSSIPQYGKLPYTITQMKTVCDILGIKYKKGSEIIHP